MVVSGCTGWKRSSSYVMEAVVLLARTHWHFWSASARREDVFSLEACSVLGRDEEGYRPLGRSVFDMLATQKEADKARERVGQASRRRMLGRNYDRYGRTQQSRRQVRQPLHDDIHVLLVSPAVA